MGVLEMLNKMPSRCEDSDRNIAIHCTFYVYFIFLEKTHRTIMGSTECLNVRIQLKTVKVRKPTAGHGQMWRSM